MEADKNGHQADTGSAATASVASAEPDTIMTSITPSPTAATSTTTKAITMDGYRKRALERQREQEKQKKHQKTDPTTPSTISVHPHTPAGPGLPPLNEHPQQQPVDKVINLTSAEASAGASNKAGGATASANGHNHHHHRKAPSSQAPRTTSPPTSVSGGSVSTPSHKSAGPKGPKAIHAIELIRIAGEILQFPPATIGTSLVYYHKYRAYLHQAYKRNERDNEATKADEYLFATACLHLACKCTEVSRKVRDLVNVTYRVMNPNQPVLSLSTATKPTEDNSTTLDSIPPLSNNQQQPLTYPTAPPPTAQTYWTIRDSLLTTELMLLRILQFDLDVALPFSDVLRIYKGMSMVFAPTDEEAAQMYPDASNFDVFLPSLHQHHQHHHGHSGSSSSTPNKHGTPSSSLSAPLSSLPNSGPHLAAHIGIHPTLSALVQISITFCIDALCSSTIALNSSSRALAMGAIYLAIRSAGLELPLPFEEWCYAWGRPMISAGFGIPAPGGGGTASGSGGYGMGPGGSIAGSSTGGAGGVSGGAGMNGLLGLATTSLFVSSPRPQQGDGGYMDGLELSSETVSGGGSLGSAAGGGSGSSGAGAGALNGNDSIHSQNDSPQLLSNTLSPALLTGSAMDGLDGPVTQPQPMTIVDEVRKVVQELGSFYTH
ncbi:hypothetical protein BGZ82_003703 [Podila clonocystis]|nr:hypothetical protein BGZ82_003703 [Podila clonocystis]